MQLRMVVIVIFSFLVNFNTPVISMEESQPAAVTIRRAEENNLPEIAKVMIQAFSKR